jgi:dTDP-4-amino-4,6-dideoxygalactose transaminase
MNDINATIGLCNIVDANQSVLAHRKNSKYIIDNVSNANLILPEYDETCSFWLFSMHVLNGLKSDFTQYLEENGISSSPVHFRNDMYDCTLKFAEKDLPGVTSFDKTQICIPNGWWLEDSDLDHIVDTLYRYKK